MPPNHRRNATTVAVAGCLLASIAFSNSSTAKGYHQADGTMPRHLHRSLCSVLLALSTPSVLYAQASILGVVVDVSGAGLPDVTVEASSSVLTEKVRSVVTDGTGQYKIEQLRPGLYSVSFMLPGFATVRREGIKLTGSTAATVNAELRVGAVEEVVTVTRAPGADASLSTTAAQQPPVSEKPTIVLQTGHVGRVNVAAFSDNSRVIATGDHLGSILVWGVESGRQLWSLAGHSSSITALSFSPDGRWLASSSGFAGSSDVRIWDLTTGRERRRLNGHKDRVLNLAFTPDSRHLATAGDTVRIWDIASGELQQPVWSASVSPRAFLSYSPDGRTIAIREETQLTLVPVSGGNAMRRLPLSGTPLRLNAVFSPDGRRVATIDNRRLKLWDSRSGARVLDKELSYQFGANVQRFSANGRELAIMLDSQFEVRDAATGNYLRPLSPSTSGPSTSGSVLSSDWRHYTEQREDQRLLTLRPTSSDQPATTLSGERVPPAGTVAFSRNGSILATKAGKRFWIWPLAGGEPRAFDGHDGDRGELQTIDMLAFLPDDRTFISADWTGRIVQRNLQSGATERSIDVVTTGSTRHHAISADGRWLVSAQQHRVALFELPAWKIRRTWDSQHRDIAVSASGRYVASASFTTDPLVRRAPWIDLWDAQSDVPRILVGHEDWVMRVAFGAGDQWLASVDLKGTIMIWDVASGGLLKTLTPGSAEPVFSLAFNRDAQILATGGANNSISLWNLRTNTVIRQMEGHLDTVGFLRFSPDGRLLASGSNDGTTRLWAADSGTELVKLLVMDGANEWLAVAPDGRFDGSPTARERMVAWRVGSIVFPADRFAAGLYKPGLLASILRDRTGAGTQKQVGR